MASLLHPLKVKIVLDLVTVEFEGAEIEDSGLLVTNFSVIPPRLISLCLIRFHLAKYMYHFA